MDCPFQLSMEQEFSLHSLGEQAKSLTREELIDILVSMHRQHLAKENYYQSLIADSVFSNK
jgi:hypothetical protein